MKSRNEVIDIAKGISIIMVVAGHCIGFIPNGWNHFELSVFFSYLDIVIMRNIVHHY